MVDDLFFSIVIPTYNREKFIGRTIQSLLDQKYRLFEIIVVDDGGTDQTGQLVKAFKDPRVRYVKKNNEERAVARNYGANLAKGNYVNFFDSDDLAYPNHLSEACAVIKKMNSPEIFHLGYDVKDPEGNIIRIASSWPKTINDDLINGNHISCNGVFVRRDIGLRFPFNGIRALSASEDYELWLRLAARFPFYCFSTITTTIVNHEMRSVLRISNESLITRIRLLERELNKDQEFVNKYKGKLKIFYAYNNIYIALHLNMAGNSKKEVIKFLKQALVCRPSVLVSKRFLVVIKKMVWPKS